MTNLVHSTKTPTLQYALIVHLVISFVAGTLLMTMGNDMVRNRAALVENYLDPMIKRSNLTRTLLARYGSIVPNKDYIPQEVDLGAWLMWLPAKLFDMGVIVVAFSAFGIYGVLARRKLFLYILMGCLSAAIVGQLLFVTSLMDLHSQFHWRVRRDLVTLMKSRYEFGAATHDPLSFVFNGAMLMGECCGVNGPLDFTTSKHSYVHAPGSNRSLTRNATVLFPLACCHRYYIERGFLSTLDCALSCSTAKINKRGCYQTLHAFLSNRFGSAITWIYLGITYVEVLQIALAYLLCRQLEAERTSEPSHISNGSVSFTQDSTGYAQQQTTPVVTDV